MHIRDDETFGLVYFNMTEDEARQVLYGAFQHFAYKHVLQKEIDDLIK